jgi:hypothetical protein
VRDLRLPNGGALRREGTTDRLPWGRRAHTGDRERDLPPIAAPEHRPVRSIEGGAVTVKILPNDHGAPAGKLADVELHFTGGPLEGLRLVGFAVWERRDGTYNVTFPARQYTVNGEKRSFAVLRPIDGAEGQERVRDLIVTAYAEFNAQARTAGRPR